MNAGVPTTRPVAVTAVALQGPGDAEVDHPRAVKGQQHVRGLEVAVDQVAAVDPGVPGARNIPVSGYSVIAQPA
jgi:hypothetical protein